jgi:hypothetical protein
LILASKHSALATRNALKRLHVPVERFAVPKSIDESLEQVTKVARLLGHPGTGQGAGRADRGRDRRFGAASWARRLRP